MSTITVRDIRPNRPQPIFSATPHRLFCFVGAVQLVATLLFWFCTLMGWYIASAPAAPFAVAGTAAHIFLMLYGLFTFFVFGF
jgi:uncharacterized protein involved in response to NO